jgi:3-deoxy-manno-octulosonate cytidylyltransferase (CMP-KDO synthetase)
VLTSSRGGTILDAITVIPARLASTRLPRKVLREVAGRPLLAWVVEAARACPGLREVIVATDSEEVLALCRAQGWTGRMTSAQHRSGTERVHEVAQAVAADVYVNIQADEPLLRPAHIDLLLAAMGDPKVQVATLKTPCAPADVNNPNAVKVVTDLTGRALYFSRSPVPHDRDASGAVRYFKHLGVYAYRRTALDRFCALPESPLERGERLEQLRFLENDIPIQVAETPHDTIGVDIEEDLRRVEAVLRGRTG